MSELFSEVLRQTQLLPQHLQLWLSWMFLVSFVVPLILIKHNISRNVFLTQIVMTVFALYLFNEAGLSRLLGLAHVLFWTPVVYYLVKNLPKLPVKSSMGLWVRVCIVTMVISLMFAVH